MSVPLNLVKQYAPLFKFHANEKCLPCSIEYLLEDSTLNLSTFVEPQKIEGQHTNTPALAFFKGSLFMVYTDSNSAQLYVSQSRNGLSWNNTQKIDGQFTSVPALAVFNDYLFMIYSDSHSSQLWVSRSPNGLTWESAQQIAGQHTDVPAVAAFEGKLFMVYSDSNSSQLWMSESDDGFMWYNTRHINGQSTHVPTVAVLNDMLVMVYPDSNGSGQLWTSQYSTSTGWIKTSQVAGQQIVTGHVWPSLASIGSWLIMVYRGQGKGNYWATRSQDGVKWQDKVQIQNQSGFTSALAVMDDILWMVYTDSHSSQLWVTFNRNGDLVPKPPVADPTQPDLQRSGNDLGWWINVSQSRFSGQSLGSAPVYYATQSTSDLRSVYITYALLFAYQGSQTATVYGVPNLDIILDDLGSHQGDLERVTVALSSPTGSSPYTLNAIYYEAHGDTHQYDANGVSLENGTHPVVNVSLNLHGFWNVHVTSDHIYQYNIPLIFGVGDICTDDNTAQAWYTWLGWDFRQIGLNAAGQPINEEVWAAYGGRMGSSYITNYKNATHLDGGELKPYEKKNVDLIWATVAPLIDPKTFQSDGPKGPADRAWIRPNWRP